MNDKSIQIPNLVSGGIMLSYKCTNRCRHCLYNASPDWDDWITLENVKKIFSILQEEFFLESIHLAGGEPFLNTSLLNEIVKLANKMKIPLHYVETNAFFADDDDKTEDILNQLFNNGLRGVLVSISPFHNEFIPLEKSKRCIRIATEIFGRENVIVWLPVFLKALEKLDEMKNHKLEEFLETFPEMKDNNQLGILYSLIPGGRVAKQLHDYYEKHPMEWFFKDTCRQELLNSTHFHFDPYGNYIPGLCGGISLTNASTFKKNVSLDNKPFLNELYNSGIKGLYELASSNYGFKPDPVGYIGKCHACSDIRKHVLNEKKFIEFQPERYYE